MRKRKKKWDWSWHNGTTLGYHLTLNPQPPMPPSVSIYRHFLDHGIVVSDLELQSILSGRDAGIRTISGILNNSTPGLGGNLALKLSTTLADALLDKSLTGQLSREYPTPLDRIDARNAIVQNVYDQLSPPPARGFLPQLLNGLPPFGAGFSVTLNF